MLFDMTKHTKKRASFNLFFLRLFVKAWNMTVDLFNKERHREYKVLFRLRLRKDTLCLQFALLPLLGRSVGRKAADKRTESC